MEEKAELTPIHRDMIEYAIHNWGDDQDRLHYLEVWESIYSPEDFKKILRMVTLARGRHLKLIK